MRTPGRLGSCVVLAAVAVVVVSAGCGGSSRSAADTTIILSDATGRLVAVRPGRRRERELLPNPRSAAEFPAWSPDGDKIAYVFNEALYVTDEHGTNVTRVVPSVENWAWSPDGEHIVYTYGNVGVVRADGSDRRVLDRCSAALCALPAWSPDGKRLAYERGSRLEDVDVDGAPHALVRCVLAACAEPGCVECGRAAWSPDGDRIAFVAENRFGCGLSVVGSDGNQLRRIVRPLDSPGSCLAVSWSPDGKLLALDRYSPAAVAVYRADDWRLVRLIQDAGDAAWSPDGRHLAFIDQYSDVLSVAGATGARRRRIGLAYEFDWSPDGSALVATHPVEHRSVERMQAEGRAPAVIWVVDVGDRQHRRLWPPSGSCDCGDPHWQPR